MNPVFRSLANKVLLGTSGRSIPLDRVALGPDQIVQLGQLHHERIVVIFEERFGIETRRKNGPKLPSGLFLITLASWRSGAGGKGERET